MCTATTVSFTVVALYLFTLAFSKNHLWYNPSVSMNKLAITLIYLLTPVGAIARPLNEALKAHHDPGYLSVVLSLIFVICLIYATGIIYNKLNNIGIKTFKAQNKDFREDNIIILSTTPLGANKTLHVVELNGKKMLIGASTNSIHLIKDLSEDITTSEAIKESIQPKNIEVEESETKEDEDFGLYKKYLR